MSNFYKSKQYDLIDMFNDTSQYLDYTLTIDNNRTPWIWDTYSWYMLNGTSVKLRKYIRQRTWFEYKSYSQ